MPRQFEATVAVRPEPEVRDIPGFPSYEASSWGEIRRRRSGRWLKRCRLKRGGYLAVALWENGKGKTMRVNRLVCLAFHGEPPFPNADAAHVNGHPRINEPDNLVWKSRLDNEADKVRHGSSNRGERGGGSVLKEADILAIRAAAAQGTPRGFYTRQAQKYGVSASAIWSIVNRRTWKHA